MNQWINKWANMWSDELVSRWVNESMSQRMNGWMVGWVSCFFVELLLHLVPLLAGTSSLSSLLPYLGYFFWPCSELPPSSGSCYNAFSNPQLQSRIAVAETETLLDARSHIARKTQGVAHESVFTREFRRSRIFTLLYLELPKDIK